MVINESDETLGCDAHEGVKKGTQTVCCEGLRDVVCMLQILVQITLYFLLIN